MKSPVIPFPGASSEPSPTQDDPAVSAAVQAEIDTLGAEPVPERLRELTVKLAQALDRRRQDLADPDATQD